MAAKRRNPYFRGGIAVAFLVTAANPSTSNSDVPKYTITLTRYLENAIGAITTSA